MSKDSQVTNTIAESIQYDFVSGPQMKPIIRTQYQTSGTFVDFEFDITSRSISQRNDNDQYQVYGFMPPVSDMNISLNNYKQKYSPGNTASEFEGIFKKNQLIRCWSGYEMTADVGTGTASDDFSTRTKFVHTKLSGGEVIPDIASFSGTIGAYASMGVMYDATTYGATTYAYPGYYKKKFKLPPLITDANSINITTTSNKFQAKYRISSKENMIGAQWSGYQSLATGANVIPVSTDPGNEWFETVVRFNNEAWGTADRISSVGIKYGYKAQLFKVGTFVLDEPVFGNADLKLTGRDYLRKALETEITLPRTKNQKATNIVAKVLDRCSVPYDTDDWDLVSTTFSLNGSMAESISNKPAWQILDKVMDTVNAGDDDIRFRFSEEGKAEIKRIPTDREADWAVHYLYNTEKITQGLESGKQIQRITVLPKTIVTASELTIANFTGTLSSGVSATFTYPTAVAYYDASDNLTASTTGTTANNFLFTRYVDNSSTFGNIYSELDRTNNTVRLKFSNPTGTAYPYDFTVFGNPPNKRTGNVWAERGNAKNILSNNGSTYQRQNEFMSATTAKAYADYFIDFSGDPKKTVSLSMVANPLLELNDNLMNINQWIYDENIYGITGIEEKWGNPSLKQTIKMIERGFDLGEFVWDRKLLSDYTTRADRTINVLKWDSGFIWDQDISPNATSDSASYINTREVSFA